jgi:hypothetical protein
MELKVVGLDDLKKDFEGVVHYLGDEIEATFQDWGNETVKIARNTRQYKRRTGEADKSIQAVAKGASVKIWVNPENVTTGDKNWVYPALLHDGTKRGIKADPFITRAVAKNLRALPKAITKKIESILK